MSIISQAPATIPTLAQRAGATRSRRAKAGKYVTPTQKAAFKRMMAVGNAGLTLAELVALSGHPHLAPSQRADYGRMAAQAQIDGDGTLANMPTASAA